MGKRIDELTNLDDSPIESPDPRMTNWGLFLDTIDDLLQSGNYAWAEDTLKGIYDTVRDTEWVTPGQRLAIANIIEGGQRTRSHWRRGGWR